MTMKLPKPMRDYLTQRQQERDAAITAVLEKCTEREQILMREIAVMAYVQGAMAGRAVAVPSDTAVLRRIVAECLDSPELYPMITRVSQS